MLKYQQWRQSAANATQLKIVEHIWTNPGISRAQLAIRMGLNKSSITRSIEELQRQAIVCEMDESVDFGENPKATYLWGNIAQKKKGRRGRPAGALAINPKLGVVLGIELSAKMFQLVVLDAVGRLQHKQRVQIPKGQSLVFALRLRYALQCAARFAEQQRLAVLALGIGLSGIVRDQVLIYSDLHAVESPVRIEEPDFPFRIVVDNDVHCCAQMQLLQNNWNDSGPLENFLAVLGEFHPVSEMSRGFSPLGIGLAFVLEGKVFRGHSCAAGEFQSIFKNQENFSQFDVSNRQLSHFYDDPAILNALLDELCRNLAFLAVSLDVQKVCFFGDIVAHKPKLQTLMEAALTKQWPHPTLGAQPTLGPQHQSGGIDVGFSGLGELGVAAGAGASALQKLFVAPLARAPTRKRR